MTAFISAQRAAGAAYQAAGIGPADLDLAEIYAPCTIVQVLVTEAMGLTQRGRGAAQAAAGETALGGRIPVCTSGGCLSRGHPAYITGLLTIYELWEQLTHRAGERQVRDARLAAGSCELGNYNAALIHILEAVA
jgi:acetyl-CoA C-acetyltransferase